MKIRIYTLGLLFLFILFQSCGAKKLTTENKQLRLRIAELEMRIYELTDSPDHLAEELIQDIDLLLTIPSSENLELATAMIQTFKRTYPNNKYNKEIDQKKNEIERLEVSENYSKMNSISNELNDNGDVKIQFGIQVTEQQSGFLSVSLSAQNLSSSTVSNVWVKATLVDRKGESYGITQDFFFNRLKPYELLSETLSWEYVQFEHIEGIALKQIRYSKNRQIKLLRKEDCLINSGNVKIFLEL